MKMAHIRCDNELHRFCHLYLPSIVNNNIDSCSAENIPNRVNCSKIERNKVFQGIFRSKKRKVAGAWVV